MRLALRTVTFAVLLAPLACGGGGSSGGTPGASGNTGASGAAGAIAMGGAPAGAGSPGTAGGSETAGSDSGGGAGLSGLAGGGGVAGSSGGAAGGDASSGAGGAMAGAGGGAPVLNADVVALMKRVADNALQNPGTAKDWIYGTMWTGIMATYQITHDAKYLDAIKKWAGADWMLANGAASRGDNQCAAQTFFDAYLLDPTPANMVMLTGAKASYDQLVANPPKGRVEWWWEDALFMVPPGFARLGAATANKQYFSVLDGMYWDTYAFLWSPTANLMYRDDMHRNEFWARGNGWVIAGAARVLQYLPADDAKRADYVKVITDMAGALKKVQGTDGMWRSNLLVPTQYPNQETTGTGLFAYGMAWAMNNGELDKATYLPVVQKAWTGLTSVVSANGAVGWCQPVGAGPAAATAGSTTPFGIGAWLLAASEVAKLAP
jgi:unsaturated rhamnogalacturonyl hydrolase